MQPQITHIENNTNIAPPKLKSVMQRYGKMHKLERGENLPPGINKGNYIYLVVAGAVKISHELSGGDEILIDLFTNGDIVIIQRQDNADGKNIATALETTYIRILSIYQFEEISREQPTLQNQLLLALNRHTISLQRRLIFLRFNATERVADFLLGLLNCNRTLKNCNIHLPLSRQEIGCYLGLTAETVCRVLCQLELSGIIRKHGRSIEVIDQDALIEKSGGLREGFRRDPTPTNVSEIFG